MLKKTRTFRVLKKGTSAKRRWFFYALLKAYFMKYFCCKAVFKKNFKLFTNLLKPYTEYQIDVWYKDVKIKFCIFIFN
ncbi:hypothetical protein BCY91_14720 [Pelobium manganitolerans]|uniref:Uncharacterized protein n=1 Tax=Pelobium manganitolerans TaxID=1842495 RepID=A0A419S9T3_9SPHI|nr:hypothetical protein BCY91_14720 [Pelobium manganitolerans]